MGDRLRLELTEEQTARYRQWAATLAAGYHGEGLIGPEITLSFTLSPIGRYVEARCGTSRLVLQDDFGYSDGPGG